jgi:hypothetical protein
MGGFGRFFFSRGFEWRGVSNLIRLVRGRHWRESKIASAAAKPICCTSSHFAWARSKQEARRNARAQQLQNRPAGDRHPIAPQEICESRAEARTRASPKNAVKIKAKGRLIDTRDV